MTVRIIPAIMSGGAGTRLWPLSTEDKPKQFHALTSARSMFAETAARLRGGFDGVSFAPPVVLCGARHVTPVRNALSEVGAGATAIIVEPCARNTAAVAAVAAAFAEELDAAALVLLAPADHAIADVAAFHAALARAARFAHDRIVTFGMTPSYAATGYGYIKSGVALSDGVFTIEAFKEKPDETAARAYLSAGGFTWNSGMFLFAPRVLLAEFAASAAIREHAVASLRNAKRVADEVRLNDFYADAPSLPLDIAVMEHTARAAVVPCDIGWADVGSWAEVLRLAERNAEGFAVLGTAATGDASKITASGVKALAVEGDDLVIVAAPNGILILPRAQSADVASLRRLAQQL